MLSTMRRSERESRHKKHERSSITKDGTTEVVGERFALPGVKIEVFPNTVTLAVGAEHVVVEDLINGATTIRTKNGDITTSTLTIRGNGVVVFRYEPVE